MEIGGVQVARARTLTVFVLVMAVMVVPGGGPAGASEPGVRAVFDGRVINLARDWEGASACAVLSKDDVRCFASVDRLRAALAPDVATVARPVAAAAGLPSGIAEFTPDCGGIWWRWLYLYEHANFGGRVLQFNDVNFWQNLTDFGFNDTMSSWWNDTQCTGYIGEHIWGGGAHLILPPYSWSAFVGWDWNDVGSSVLLAG
jgi:hypothetical protein